QHSRPQSERERRPRVVADDLRHVELLLQLVQRAREPLARQLDVAPDVSRRFNHSLSSVSVVIVSRGASCAGARYDIPRFANHAVSAPATTSTMSAATQ